MGGNLNPASTGPESRFTRRVTFISKRGCYKLRVTPISNKGYYKLRVALISNKGSKKDHCKGLRVQSRVYGFRVSLFL